MFKGSNDVHMKEIDLDSIEDVEQSDEAVQFIVRLSDIPSQEWMAEFFYLYEREPHTIKPPIEIEDDVMHIQFLPRYDEELQDFLDFVGEICRRASEEAELTLAIQASEEKDMRKREFREFLATMRLPA